MIGENRLDLAILELFLRNTYLRLSINQIATRLGKTYPNINKKVNELIREGVLSKMVVGRSHLCSLNLENPKTRLLSGLIELSRLESSKARIIKEIQTRLKDLGKIGEHTFSLLKGRTVILCVTDKTPFLQASLPRPWRLQLADHQDMEQLLQDPSIFSDHLLLSGYDRYFEFINDHASHLRRYHDQLLQHHG